MAARRVADEHGELLGERVGYSVRFEEVASARTRIRYATEGIVLRRLVADPELRGVSAVILDEFHERHLATDLLLVLLARLSASTRPDLKLVVMSATLDAEPVARYLGDCPRVRSEGRMFPVSIEFLSKPDDRPLEKQVVSAVRQAVSDSPQGDVLVSCRAQARSAKRRRPWSRSRAKRSSWCCRCTVICRSRSRRAPWSLQNSAKWCWPRTWPNPRSPSMA